MGKITKLGLIIVILISLAGYAAFSSTESASFKLPVSGVSSGSSSATSDAFSLSTTAGALQIGSASSASFSLKLGFNSVISAASLAPLVTAITPANGKNNSPVKITSLTGANFIAGTTVKLTKTGFDDISAYNVVIVSSSEITCEFNLAGAKIGVRDVSITTSNGTGTLPSGFEVKTSGIESGLVLNSPNPFNPAIETTTIMYNLDTAADVNVYMFTTTADLVVKKTYLSGTEGGKTGSNSITWDGASGFSELASNGVYLIHVVEKATGKTLAKGKIAVLR